MAAPVITYASGSIVGAGRAPSLVRIKNLSTPKLDRIFLQV